MQEYTISVLIPCYNEAGNISECVRRTPSMGRWTEIIVIDDGSLDNTGEVIQSIVRTDKRVKLISYYPNKGKGTAIAEGIRVATGDIIMVLDADMTVPPEVLPQFYRTFISSGVDILIGTRFKQKFSQEAMGRINQILNKIAATVFSFLCKTEITDTLCGTKVLWRKHANLISFDKCRWGDFEILREAAVNGSKIRELAVPYQERKYGTSSVRMLPDGIHLCKRAGEIIAEVIGVRLHGKPDRPISKVPCKE